MLLVLTTKDQQYSAHRSANEFAANSRVWVGTSNQDAAVRWHKIAAQILDRPRRLLRRNQPSHQAMT